MSDSEKKTDDTSAKDTAVPAPDEPNAAENAQVAPQKGCAPQKSSSNVNNKTVEKTIEPAAEESEESDTSDDEDEEPKLGLLEKPVQIESGKRERKKVERLSEQLSAAVTSSAEKKLVPVEGTGQKLGECPEIEHEIHKQSADDLKNLHKLLFSRPGTVTEVKKNIRKFSGFTFDKESDEYQKKLESLHRLTTQQIKLICEVLGQERTGSKEQLADRVLDFLLNPKSSGKVPKSAKKGKASKKSKGKKQAKAASSSAKEDKKPKSKTKAADKDAKDDSGASGMDSAGEDNSEESKQKKESPQKKIKVRLSPKKETSKVKKEKVKTDAKIKPTPKKRKTGKEKGENSDDEPLVKKVKKEPSEGDLRKFIKKILDAADLEEVTMKTVIKKVYSEYPDADLTPKKDFIKDTVKEILGA